MLTCSDIANDVSATAQSVSELVPYRITLFYPPHDPTELGQLRNQFFWFIASMASLRDGFNIDRSFLQTTLALRFCAW